MITCFSKKQKWLLVLGKYNKCPPNAMQYRLNYTKSGNRKNKKAIFLGFLATNLLSIL
jgi:hypothetical protein